MMKNEEMIDDEVWKSFLRKHWKATLSMIGAGVGAAIAGLLVFLWVVADAQATGLVPAGLGEWTVGYVFTFMLNVILWELILVGSWVIPVAIGIFFQWYKKLPDEERKKYEGKPKKKWPRHGMSAGGDDGGIGLLVFITWLIIVWVDGKWNLAFQSWTFNDWIYTGLAAILWDLLIIGVPAGILIIWWTRRGMKQET
ncbi:MAG: hypothetical protein V3U09_00930 [Thermoplasmata archaeon]